MKLTQAQRYLRKIAAKPARSESYLQRKIVGWCRGLGDGIVRERFFAVPNGWGSVRSVNENPKDRAIAGARLKAEGAKAGVPDLIFFGCFGEPGNLTPTMLWMEVKNGTGGVISPSQKVMHDLLRANGHRIVVARDLADALRAIINFYRPGNNGGQP